ncbi:MAG: hypothetical protein IJ714_07975 [Bacteroidales bacterium]|nr:hypothetical protein [Bacteroidales bacterium]
MQYTYHLRKYAGKSSRLTCPSCERPYCFTPYVDDDDNILDPTVGRCDHESSCAYHKTPAEYFREHPEARPREEDWRQAPDWLKRDRPRGVPGTRHAIRPDEAGTRSQMPVCELPAEIVAKTLRNVPKSTLQEFLETIFTADVIERLRADYRLGVTKDRSVVFYQIDIQDRIRTGKIMQYNPTDGHRVKNVGVPVDWAHARLKKSGLLPESWTVTQCLFGEHLLPQRPDAIVCLVESEKTAIIGSGFCPQYIWVATGGKTQLGPKLSVLQGRKVLVFPDIDATAEWREKLSSIPGLNFTFSTILEDEASAEDRAAQIDVADWLLRTVPPVPSNPGTEQPYYSNPVAREVAKYFPAEVMPEVAALIDDLDLELVSVTQIQPS